MAGGEGLNQSILATKAAGKIAQIGFPTGQATALSLMPLIFRQTTIRGIAVAPRSSFERMNAFRCGMEAVVELLGGKWKLLILYHLRDETLRFSELRRTIGNVSEKMLSQQLKEMARDGLIHRIDFQTVPPHVEYKLTALGLDLSGVMKAVADWGNRNMGEIVSIRGQASCEAIDG